MSGIDPITLQVIRARLDGVVQEMQNSLFRTGFSTIIRESQDASCAILNREGEVIAQHVVLPLHMGAFPACAGGLLKSYPPSEICEGDAFITNHPYLGGSPHAPDMGVFTPIFYRSELVGFSANMAHKSDVGGTVPGSGSGQAREIFEEGLHLPAVKLASRYRTVQEIEQIITANSRTPELVIGDIRGQVGANRLGEKRVFELMEKYGIKTVLQATERLASYTEERVRKAVASWPDGRYEGEGFVDHDGIDLDRPIRIHVLVDKEKDRIHFDFSQCSDETRGPANIRPPLVRACCYYCLVCLVDPSLPINQGLSRVVDATFREGSVVHPRFPAAVNTYMPTALVVAEAILQALGNPVPEKRIARGSGSAAIALGGRGASGQRGYVQYEILTGGTGARSGRDGAPATAFHLSNGKMAPVEIVESEFPTRVERFELTCDSGGPGLYRGGLGFVREYRILQDDVRFSMRSDKHVIAPSGISGGKDGATGACIISSGSVEEARLPSRFGDYVLKRDNLVRLERPGGGGLGDPLDRDPEKVLEDVRQGYVSVDSAEKGYGVIVRTGADEISVDRAGTKDLRSGLPGVKKKPPEN
jgi:N-methylhydantoinase B